MPVARDRLQGEVIDLGPDDLAMSIDEAAQILGHAGVELDDGALDALVHRTEGWPGGLHLAALALSGAPTHQTPALSGRAPLVADYLVQEVLAGLPAPTQDFLERSSVLDEMSAARLDELLERDDSARRLAEVEQSGNQFLVVLDDEASRYRYHQLFRDVLRARLDARDPTAARRLERRAGAMLEADGDVDGAIGHAMAAGDTGHAARMILGHTRQLVFAGQTQRLRQLLDRIGLDSMRDHPEAAVAWGWCGLSEGDRHLLAEAIDVRAGARVTRARSATDRPRWRSRSPCSEPWPAARGSTVWCTTPRSCGAADRLSPTRGGAWPPWCRAPRAPCSASTRRRGP